MKRQRTPTSRSCKPDATTPQEKPRPEQISAWPQACVSGQQSTQAQRQVDQEQARADKKCIAELERELRCKDKALAETAAVLVLRKKMNAFWGKRQQGRLTSLPERQQLVERFNHVVASGARKANACAEIGLSLRSLRRWALTPVILADVRTTTPRPRPLNSLSAEERRAILEVCNSPPFASLPPSQKRAQAGR